MDLLFKAVERKHINEGDLRLVCLRSASSAQKLQAFLREESPNTPGLIIPAAEKRLNNRLRAFNRTSAVNRFISSEVKQEVQEHKKNKPVNKVFPPSV